MCVMQRWCPQQQLKFSMQQRWWPEQVNETSSKRFKLRSTAAKHAPQKKKPFFGWIGSSGKVGSLSFSPHPPCSGAVPLPSPGSEQKEKEGTQGRSATETDPIVPSYKSMLGETVWRNFYGSHAPSQAPTTAIDLHTGAVFICCIWNARTARMHVCMFRHGCCIHSSRARLPAHVSHVLLGVQRRRRTQDGNGKGGVGEIIPTRPPQPPQQQQQLRCKQGHSLHARLMVFTNHMYCAGVSHAVTHAKPCTLPVCVLTTDQDSVTQQEAEPESKRGQCYRWGRAFGLAQHATFICVQRVRWAWGGITSTSTSTSMITSTITNIEEYAIYHRQSCRHFRSPSSKRTSRPSSTLCTHKPKRTWLLKMRVKRMLRLKSSRL